MTSTWEEQSAFNMGLAILSRIDKILTFISTAKLTSDVQAWYSGVFTLKGEVYYKLKPEERAEIDSLLTRCAPLVTQATRFSKLGRSFSSPDLLKLLDATETRLKELLDARGMLMAKKSDPRYAAMAATY